MTQSRFSLVYTRIVFWEISEGRCSCRTVVHLSTITVLLHRLCRQSERQCLHGMARKRCRVLNNLPTTEVDEARLTRERSTRIRHISCRARAPNRLRVNRPPTARFATHAILPQEAFLQEDEVAQALAGRGCMFEDPAFPASGDSLYRTPQQPPAGTLPAALVVWGRISQLEVRRCHSPATFPVGEFERETSFEYTTHIVDAVVAAVFLSRRAFLFCGIKGGTTVSIGLAMALATPRTSLWEGGGGKSI